MPTDQQFPYDFQIYWDFCKKKVMKLSHILAAIYVKKV